MRYRLFDVIFLAGLAAAFVFSPHASAQAPVSYTHLDVYKRQLLRVAIQYRFDLGHGGIRCVFPCGNELRSLHEFIPEHVVHPWFDEHVGLTTPRLIRDSLNN